MPIDFGHELALSGGGQRGQVGRERGRRGGMKVALVIGEDAFGI